MINHNLLAGRRVEVAVLNLENRRIVPQPYRRGLSDSRPTIRAYREAYATLKDLPGRAREGQFGAVNRVVGAWDIYRRYPFTICGGVLLAAAPFLSKGN